jgi:CheY-like chemotaxis protein
MGKCLVIDDNAVALKTGARFVTLDEGLVTAGGQKFKYKDVDVDRAVSRAEALAKVEAAHSQGFRYEVIITDMQMFGDSINENVSGAHFIENLRAFEVSHPLPNVPKSLVVICSTEMTLDKICQDFRFTCGESLENDFQGYLPKPLLRRHSVSLAVPSPAMSSGSHALSQSSPSVVSTQMSVNKNNSELGSSHRLFKMSEDEKTRELPLLDPTNVKSLSYSR